MSNLTRLVHICYDFYQFIDITSSAFEQRHEPRYVEWQRINDYDGDGYLELYENQHKSNWWIRRWDGSRFKKIN